MQLFSDDEFFTIYDCAGAVAEFLMATNAYDLERCRAIVDTCEGLNIKTPHQFIGSIHELLTAIDYRKN